MEKQKKKIYTHITQMVILDHVLKHNQYILNVKFKRLKNNIKYHFSKIALNNYKIHLNEWFITIIFSFRTLLTMLI